jgi:hypothetical protein
MASGMVHQVHVEEDLAGFVPIPGFGIDGKRTL